MAAPPSTANAVTQDYSLRCSGCDEPAESLPHGLCEDCEIASLDAAVGAVESDENAQGVPNVETEPEPEPEPGQERFGDRGIVYELLELHREGKADVAPVSLGPLPQRAPGAQRGIRADLELRFGLLVAEGIQRALMYARSEAVVAGHVATRQGASYALRRLVEARVVYWAGEMPLRGKGNGTNLFVPPGWRPEDREAFTVAIELRQRDRLANLVWIPDEPTDVASVKPEPALERAREVFLSGGFHSSNSATDPVIPF